MAILLPAAAICEEQVAEKSFAEEEAARVKTSLKSHGALSLLYRAEVEGAIGLDELPDELTFEKGQLSLVPDPKDRCEGRIAVYLVNSTDKVVTGIDYYSTQVTTEVKDGNHWANCSPIRLGCGNSVPHPVDLKPGQALLLAGDDPSVGDLEGELRFILFSSPEIPLASRSFAGKFSSKEFNSLEGRGSTPNRELSYAFEEISSGSSWESGWMIRSPGELVAATNLQRSYDDGRYFRDLATKCLDITGIRDNPSLREELQKTLSAPWDNCRDQGAVFDRAWLALNANAGGRWSQGAPERNKALVWRFLTTTSNPWKGYTLNPEQRALVEKIKQSENPWGASKEQASQLVALAVQRLQGTDPEERKAAGGFLQETWIKASHLPDEVVTTMLAAGDSISRDAALAAMANRGKRAEAGAWLLQRRDIFHNEIGDLWRLVSRNSDALEDWEAPIAAERMKADFGETLIELAKRCRIEASQIHKPPLPDILCGPVRAYLSEEATNPRVILSLPPHRDDLGRLKFDLDGSSWQRSAPLRYALILLGSVEDPKDSTLLKEFLKHPGCSYSTGDTPMRAFEIRDLAAQILKARGDQVPPDTVFMEKVQD